MAAAIWPFSPKPVMLMLTEQLPGGGALLAALVSLKRILSLILAVAARNRANRKHLCQEPEKWFAVVLHNNPGWWLRAWSAKLSAGQ